jgi:uncharacterized glyoxalase superfamily protein PhnB
MVNLLRNPAQFSGSMPPSPQGCLPISRERPRNRLWGELPSPGKLPPMQNRSVPVDTVMPHIVYQDLPAAIAWLSRAFGFAEHYRYGHGPSSAQMWAGRACIMVRSARGEGLAREKSPAEQGFSTQSLTIFVDDVDGHCARARAAGAIIVEEPHETVYGEYQYAALDLDGHHWLFSRHATDRSPEEWGAVIAANHS